MQRIVACVLANLELISSEADERLLTRNFFADWPRMLEKHLRRPEEAEYIEALLAHFGGDWVPQPLDAESLAALRAELEAAKDAGAALDEADQAAPEALTAEDLSLAISSDVDAALLDVFLHDSPPQAAEVTQSLQRWIADPSQGELLRNANRAAHTLKGSANILGIRGVGKLAHRLEDILEICEADSAPPSALRARALTAAADCLEQMVAAVTGEDTAPDNAMAVIELLDAARDSQASEPNHETRSPAPLTPPLATAACFGSAACHALHASHSRKSAPPDASIERASVSSVIRAVTPNAPTAP